MLFAHWGCSRSNGITEFFLGVSPIGLSIVLAPYDRGAVGISCSRQSLLTNTRMVSLPQPSQSLHICLHGPCIAQLRGTLSTQTGVNGFSRSYAMKRHWTALSHLLRIRSNTSFSTQPSPHSLADMNHSLFCKPAAYSLQQDTSCFPGCCFMWVAYLSHQTIILNLSWGVLGPFEKSIKDTNIFPKGKNCTNTCNITSDFRKFMDALKSTHSHLECSFQESRYRICLVCYGIVKTMVSWNSAWHVAAQ